jgi:hypothetical protein
MKIKNILLNGFGILGIAYVASGCMVNPDQVERKVDIDDRQYSVMINMTNGYARLSVVDSIGRRMYTENNVAGDGAVDLIRVGAVSPDHPYTTWDAQKLGRLEKQMLDSLNAK